MQRQGRAARVVATAGVDQEQVGTGAQVAHGGFQQRPFPERQQASRLVCSEVASNHCPIDECWSVTDDGCGPGCRSGGCADATRRRDDNGANAQAVHTGLRSMPGRLASRTFNSPNGREAKVLGSRRPAA